MFTHTHTHKEAKKQRNKETHKLTHSAHVHICQPAGGLDLLPLPLFAAQAGAHQNNNSLSKLCLPSLSMGSAFPMLSEELDNFVLPDNMETSLVNLNLPAHMRLEQVRQGGSVARVCPGSVARVCPFTQCTS